MKKRLPILFSGLLAASFLSIAFVVPSNGGDEPGKEAVIMQAIIKNLERYHFDPAKINDDFSNRTYDFFLNDLDGARLFFTKVDLAQVEQYRDQLDDESSAGTFDFFDKTQELHKAARAKTQAWYQEILAQPFDLDDKATFTIRNEDSEWTANDEELKAYWQGYLKRDALRRITNKLEEQEKRLHPDAESELESESEDGAEEEEKPILTLEEIEEEVRADILKTYDRWYDRLEKAKRSQRLSQYINAFTSMYDPHTNYYRPRDKENFDIRFSGRLEGIGATLQTDDDYTKVASLVVGGPAWKGKELEEDDIIMAVRQDEDEEAVDIKGMVLDDVVGMIRGKKGTTVHLTIKSHASGETSVISIERDVVVIDERFAKSLILDGVGEGEKIGYIYLPSFYADFKNPDGRFCSKDVKAEIEKLKKEQVDGIILDLRNNGGGSLKDVVDMTGYFIPEGPIVQVQDRINNTEILRDKDDRVQYDGPLAVMVNQYSASASEILAAALQDYGRAVIIGSNSTFGKGTVQRFIDLDRTLRGFSEVKPLGTIKLTMQKFFRIDGGSTQLRGVVPDIILPDTYAYLETGEKKENNPMEWTQIESVPFDQDAFYIDNKAELQANSAKRIAQNPTFSLIEENAQRFKRLRDRKEFPLDLSTYRAEEKSLDEEAKRFKDMFEEEVNTGVHNLEEDLPGIEQDESKEARNEEFLKDVKTDVYIHEAVQVVHDLVGNKSVGISDN